MGMRITMVNYQTVDKAAVQAGLSYSSEQLTSVTELYEAGMIDILREVAVTKLLEVEESEHFELPGEYSEHVEKHAAALGEIMTLVPEKHHDLIRQIEDARTQITLTEMDDYFIRGFVEGYRYLRNLNSSYRNDLLNVRR